MSSDRLTALAELKHFSIFLLVPTFIIGCLCEHSLLSCCVNEPPQTARISSSAGWLLGLRDSVYLALPPLLTAPQPSPSMRTPSGGTWLCPFNSFPMVEDTSLCALAVVTGGQRGGEYNS